MTMELLDSVKPTETESQIAGESARALAAWPGDTPTLRVRVDGAEGTPAEVELPPLAVRLLAEVLRQLGEGNAVRIVGVGEEVTTGEGAELLNVSRPYFIKLLDQGTIPHRKVGAHRRARREDVLRYRQEQDAGAHAALDALAAQAQRLGGYDLP